VALSILVARRTFLKKPYYNSHKSFGVQRGGLAAPGFWIQAAVPVRSEAAAKPHFQERNGYSTIKISDGGVSGCIIDGKRCSTCSIYLPLSCMRVVRALCACVWGCKIPALTVLLLRITLLAPQHATACKINCISISALYDTAGFIFTGPIIGLKRPCSHLSRKRIPFSFPKIPGTRGGFIVRVTTRPIRAYNFQKIYIPGLGTHWL
jgi:hypothetical protein